MYQNWGKRAFDVAGSLFGLLLLLPVMAVIAVLVRIKFGRPVIFKQPRPGKNERIFTLYKFRTMTDKKNKNGELLPDEQRLPKFGKLLRATSLDELPELFNILKGDMSFVGPRPLLVEYLPFYSREQRQRHNVKPGLTGLAQINGRNELSFERRFQYDIAYSKHVTFWGDVQILFKTVEKVCKREGITSNTAATMEKFNETVRKSE